jgi:PAS domain-containing protein
VRATTVRVDTEAGAAMLAIFVDDTDRLAAEQAVRRSESMLAHLVATSPDLITLTDMATGRFAMVNNTFERSMGWKANEAVGRTAQNWACGATQRPRGSFCSRCRTRAR